MRKESTIAIILSFHLRRRPLYFSGFWGAGAALEPDFSTGAFNTDSPAQIASTAFQHVVWGLLIFDGVINRVPVFISHYGYLFIISVAYLFTNLMFALLDMPVYAGVTW